MCRDKKQVLKLKNARRVKKMLVSKRGICERKSIPDDERFLQGSGFPRFPIPAKVPPCDK
jgi:hypothetical protein